MYLKVKVESDDAVYVNVLVTVPDIHEGLELGNTITMTELSIYTMGGHHAQPGLRPFSD